MSLQSARFSAALCLVIAGSSGCRSGPPPDILYREAEGLRLKCERAASEQALAKYEAAAVAWTRSGNFREAARARQRLGMSYAQLGLLQPSLRAYDAALADAKAAGDAGIESELLSDVGAARSFVAVRERDFDHAQESCQAALELSRRAGGGRAEARAFACLGDVAYNRGDRERALGLYRQAAVISGRVGDVSGLAEALSNQAAVYSDQGEYGLAESGFSQSREAWATLGDARGLAITLVGVSKVHERRGEYQEALNGLHAALESLQRIGDAVWEGACLSAIASVYMRAGEPVNALDYWERALGRFTVAGMSPFSVDLLRSLGQAYLASGDDRSALERFERALALGEELGDDHWQAYALQDIGTVHLYRGNYEAAVRFFERSLAVQARMRDPLTQAQTRASLGEAWRLRREFSKARASFDAAIEFSRLAEDRLGEARALDGLARVFADLSDLDTARRHVERALDLAESLRAELGSRDMRASYFAAVYRYYETHRDVLMRLHQERPGRGFDAAAFGASEQARARSLLDRLAEAGVDLRKDMAPPLLRREESLQKEFDAWAGRHRRTLTEQATPAVLKQLADEYRDLETRYGALEAEIRTKSPRYAALARPQPLTLKQVQQRVLDQDTVLLEYALGEERSYVWVASASACSVHALPSRATIERAVKALYGAMTARLTLSGTLQERWRKADEADFLYSEQAAELSRVLLGPAARAIAGMRIVVVPDGALQYVPFAALPEPGRVGEPVPLIAGHEIVSLPSASALAALRQETEGRRPPAGAVAVLADPVFEPDDPRLRAALRAAGTPGGAQARPIVAEGASPLSSVPAARLRLPRLAATRLEAGAILEAAGARPAAARLDFEASRAAAMSPELRRYRIVHFATHGLLDNDNPGMSGIMLSLFNHRGEPVNGFLRLHDIYGLALPADLVVLSACSTALGRHLNGEGLTGIVRGFMYAGSRRVAASLWKVDDEATGELMRRFYDGMLKRGLSPAAALREAQLGVRGQRRWKAPFYWAAFILQGEWKP